MKRLILLSVIFVASAIYFASKFDIQIVDAANPNAKSPFVSEETVNNILQSNLNLLWDAIDDIKSELGEINSRLDTIESKLN